MTKRQLLAVGLILTLGGMAWFADDRSDPFAGLNALVDAEGT